MAGDTGFVLTGVKWRTQRSREIGVQQPQEVRVGVLSALAVCRACGETWMTTEGTRPGQFRQAMGALHISCPKCSAQGEVSTHGLD